MADSSGSSARGWRAVPRTVWALGFVSLFMDISSEMVHAFLPVFLVSTLGASATLVGVIEGIAEGDLVRDQDLLRRSQRLAPQAQAGSPSWAMA